MGGMGNQMFQYAAARALALRNRVPLKIDLSLLEHRDPCDTSVQRDYALGLFAIDERFASKKEIEYFNPTSRSLIARIKRRIERHIQQPRVYLQEGYDYDPRIRTLTAPMCLVGSLQSERYFEDYADMIRQELTCEEPLIASAMPVAQTIDEVTSVAVHVRRGDYVSNPHFSKLLGAMGPHYYRNAFINIERSLSNPHFFIFSDDIQWCQENLNPPQPATYISDAITGGQAIQDFMLMTRCKHFIIPNSTFGWWGAWLGTHPDKRVIAPRQWSASGSLRSEHRVPDAWTLME